MELPAERGETPPPFQERPGSHHEFRTAMTIDVSLIQIEPPAAGIPQKRENQSGLGEEDHFCPH